jgi:uncharacterized protein (TIGR02996 family)
VRTGVTESSHRAYNRNGTVYPSFTARNAVNSHSALLTLILENPADDTARLVLADLLRESDDEVEQSRGRFIWAGVTAHGLYVQGKITDPVYLTARTELLTLSRVGWPARWMSSLEIGPSPLTVNDWSIQERISDRLVVNIGPRLGVFVRGMLTGLCVGLADWFDVADKALTSWPIEFVQMNDVPGLEMQIRRHAEEWEIACGFVHGEDCASVGEFDRHYWQFRESFGSRVVLVKWMLTYGYAVLQTAVDRLSEGDWTNVADRF